MSLKQIRISSKAVNKAWRSGQHSGFSGSSSYSTNTKNLVGLSIFELDLYAKLKLDYIGAIGIDGAEEWAEEHIRLLREKGLVGSMAERQKLFDRIKHR
jgi:hypothetical protein